jgi:hypothetical protein
MIGYRFEWCNGAKERIYYGYLIDRRIDLHS